MCSLTRCCGSTPGTSSERAPVTKSNRRADEPVLLRDAIDAVGRTLGMPPPDAFTKLSQAWPTVAGAQFATHVSVRSLRDGVCTVEVDGAGWATQLRYAEQELVQRAEECCGPGVVTSIRVVLRGR
jgi:predicted nucleic acid-binding Zn ribbon protein